MTTDTGQETLPDAEGRFDEMSDDVSANGLVIWERIDWIACAVLLVVAMMFVGLHVRAYPTLSPIDELQHVDYMIKAGNFDVPRQNERLGYDAMAEAACRGIDAPQYLPPPCGLDSYDPDDFPERGVNTAASQFPIYYGITGVAARVATATGLIDSDVTAGRLIGGLWLGGALALTWYLLAMFGVDRRARAVMLGLLASTPLVVFHSATINADALLLLTGALGLLATLKFEQRRLRWWWLLAVYAALIIVEPTNLLVGIAGSVYLAVRVSMRPDEPLARRLAPLCALPMLALMRTEIAPWIQDALYPKVASTTGGGASTSNVARQVTGVSLDRILSQLPSTFTPVSNTYLPPPLRNAFTINLLQLTNWILIGLLFAAAFVVVMRAREALLARVAIGAMLLAGPLYTWYYAYFSNVDYPAPGRFGLPLLPLAVVAAATALRTRSVMYVAGLVAAVSVVNTTVLLVRG